MDITEYHRLPPEEQARVLALAQRAESRDGVYPLNEEAVLALASGTGRHLLAQDSGELVGYAYADREQTEPVRHAETTADVEARSTEHAHADREQTEPVRHAEATADVEARSTEHAYADREQTEPADSAAQIVVDPEHRRRSVATELVARLGPGTDLWAFGNCDSAQEFCAALGFLPVRGLLVMERPLAPPATPPSPPVILPSPPATLPSPSGHTAVSPGRPAVSPLVILPKAGSPPCSPYNQPPTHDDGDPAYGRMTSEDGKTTKEDDRTATPPSAPPATLPLVTPASPPCHPAGTPGHTAVSPLVILPKAGPPPCSPYDQPPTHDDGDPAYGRMTSEDGKTTKEDDRTTKEDDRTTKGDVSKTTTPDRTTTSNRTTASEGTTISGFVASDLEELVRLNARAFAGHPEQGRWTAEDFLARIHSAWFDPDGLLIARDEQGAMVGFHWTKVEDGVGEVYVLGVDPDHTGAGLGRRLLDAGLARLAARGADTARLWVDQSNRVARTLYEASGFSLIRCDIRYHMVDDESCVFCDDMGPQG